MRSRFFVLAVVSAAVAGLLPSRAEAHALILVVKLSPDAPGVVRLEASFDDEMPAEDAKVVITDAAGTVIAEGRTDERGLCELMRPGPGKYFAVVEALGHKDRVEFEVAGVVDAGGEYRGWRPDPTLGLIGGVSGLLAVSGAYWWLRQRKV